MGSVYRRHRFVAILLAAAALTAAAPAIAQPPVLEVTERLDFEDPESWAMAWFGSLAQLTGFGVPEARAAGSLELALEGGWVPTLSEDQRRVGFGGLKVEDLNRTAVIGRPRLSVGLGGGWSATLGWVPPVEVDGVEPDLFALSLDRPLWRRGSWRGGLRLHGQAGTIEGAITCNAADAAAGDDPRRNPFGCRQPSDDEMTIRSYGLELSAGYRLAGSTEPYLAASVQRFDNRFQVDALVFAIRDRTRQLAEGTTWSLTAGAVQPLGERGRVAVEVYYSPLEVRRLDAGLEPRPDEVDELLNVRILASWRLR